MSKRVGIEALAVQLPRRYLELEDLARARGVDPAKYTQGLGVRQMAVADPSEDAVALAAGAARRLIDLARVDTSRLGMLVVGTETGVDHSKAVASYVQGLLQLPRTMRTYDTQHACYGGTAGLMAAVEWIASGAAAGRKAIVICSDVARYEIGSAGEPTQGGGAVALLVSEEPDLLAIDVGLNGVSSADVYDFWRPHGRREAVVDGHYSIECYLDALAGAYRGWRQRAAAARVVGGNALLASEHLARIAYHVPFCKMAKKAHAHLRRCDLLDRAGGPLDGAALAEEERRAASSFDAQVASSLAISSRAGNAYTASLYFGLASLLDKDAAALAGQRIGLFSYGSGCCGEFYSGVVGPRAADRIRQAGIGAALDARERITLAEYERIQALPPDRPPEGEVTGGFRFTGVREHRRLYA